MEHRRGTVHWNDQITAIETGNLKAIVQQFPVAASVHEDEQPIGGPKVWSRSSQLWRSATAAFSKAQVSIRCGGRSGFLAAKDVSLQIAPGEVFGLVGESGSGKSTVLRAIAGIIPDYAGTIQVDGKALAPKRSKAQFRQIQMVFQEGCCRRRGPRRLSCRTALWPGPSGYIPGSADPA